MAPEYREENKTTQSCDIYSLGLIIIELVTGCMEVPNKDNVRVIWFLSLDCTSMHLFFTLYYPMDSNITPCVLIDIV